MAGDKYLYNNAGVITEKVSTQSSAGAGDAGEIVALDATGKLDNSLFPSGLGADTESVETTENLADGDFVNVYASTGAKCRKADATTAGKEANGFVLAASTSGNNATVYPLGLTNNHLAALTGGSVYYLATAAGTVTATAPSGSGNVVQRLGRATAADSIMTESQPAIVLA